MRLPCEKRFILCISHFDALPLRPLNTIKVLLLNLIHQMISYSVSAANVNADSTLSIIKKFFFAVPGNYFRERERERERENLSALSARAPRKKISAHESLFHTGHVASHRQILSTALPNAAKFLLNPRALTAILTGFSTVQSEFSNNKFLINKNV
jgi:hypothetical protein